MEQTTPQGEVSQDPVDRVAAIFDQSQTQAEEKPPEVQEEPQEQEAQGQADEPTPEDLPAEEEPQQPAVDAFEIVHNGKEHKLSREETIKLAQQGFDYTQKTQAVAAKDRQVEQQLQRLAQIEQVAPQLQNQLATVKALESQLAPYQGVNWVQLASTDPNAYAQHRAQFDMLRDAYGQAVGEYQRVNGAVKQELAKVHSERIRAEAQRLPDLVPEWKDQSKFEAARADITKHFQTAYGVSPEELDANADTAIKVAVLYKAMKYDQLLRSKADKSKTLRQAPPLTVPGASQATSAKADKQKQLRQTLKKTGSLEDAVAVLLNR